MRSYICLKSIIVTIVLICIGASLHAQNSPEINDILRKKTEDLDAQELSLLREHYESLITKNKYDIDANIGLMKVLPEDGSITEMESILARLWYNVDHKRLLNLISEMIDSYEKWCIYDKALFWLNILKQIDTDNSMNKYILLKVNKINEENEKSNGIIGLHDFGFLKAKSFVDKMHFNAFIKYLLPDAARGLSSVIPVSPTQLFYSLSVIEHWKFVDDMVVIDGYEAHGATSRALIVYSFVTNSGVIYYWDIYYDMIALSKDTGLLLNPKVKEIYQDWLNRLSTSYSTQSGRQLIRNFIKITD